MRPLRCADRLPVAGVHPARRRALGGLLGGTALAGCQSLAPWLTLPATAAHNAAATTPQPLIVNAGEALAIEAVVADAVTGRCVWRINGHDNPVLHLARGARLHGQIRNRLPQPTSLHWHGLQAPAASDGAGFDPIAPGDVRGFDFRVTDAGALYWYHAHPHGLTAEQVHHGLAGLLVVEDDDNRQLAQALGLAAQPRNTLTLLLQDSLLLGDQPLPYRATRRPPRDGDEALRLGNVVRVNDAVQPTFVVAPGWVRLRVLNAATARGLLIGLQGPDGAAHELVWLGCDGGLLAAPVRATAAFLYPGERADLLVQLPADAPAPWRVVSLPFDARRFASARSAAHEMTPGAIVATPSLGGDALCLTEPPVGLADGAPLPLFQLAVDARKPTVSGELPAHLSASADFEPPPAAAPVDRSFALAINSAGRWTINDQENGLDTPISVRRGAREIWEFRNSPISTPHPMHLHGFHFRVLSRRSLFGPARALTVDAAQRLPSDLGRKDTVTLWPGERLRLLIDFSHPFTGNQQYLLHCHNLEHEDSMMMLRIDVVA